MSTLRAYLGTSGLLDVGYRRYLRNTAYETRQTAGILDEGDGWYSVAGLTLAGMAASFDQVRWDSTGTAEAVAREDLSLRILLETVAAEIVKIPRAGGGAFVHTNTGTAATATVAITTS